MFRRETRSAENPLAPSCVEWGMRPLLRALVLCNGLLLGLPPGWCCPFLARAHEPAPQAKPCCHHTEETEQPSPPTPPANPEPGKPCDACACQRDATVTPDTRTLHPDVAVAIPLALAHVGTFPVGGSALSARPDVYALSPPPQLLHCVWLC
jgi:hypothetical protein